MISAARMALSSRAESFLSQIAFGLGDVRDLDAAVGKTKFAAILSNRCLINLSSADEQYGALRQIVGHLDPTALISAPKILLAVRTNLTACAKRLACPRLRYAGITCISTNGTS